MYLKTDSTKSGSFKCGCLLVLRPMRHLRQQSPSGFDGLLFACLIPLLWNLRLCMTSLRYAGFIQHKPRIYRFSNLALPCIAFYCSCSCHQHMWPIGYSQSAASRTLLYNVPRASYVSWRALYLAPSARPRHLTARAYPVVIAPVISFFTCVGRESIVESV